MPSIVWGILACAAIAFGLMQMIRPMIMRALVKKNEEPKVSAVFLWLAFFILLLAVSKLMLNLY